MNFKDRRLTTKLTQEDVARHLSIRRTTVSMWETGEAMPRADMLPKIAKLYGCTIDDLYSDIATAAQPPEEAAL